MTDVDHFARSYLVVDAAGPASAGTVADLLEAAARALRTRGEVTVQHLALDAADRAVGEATSLTVYYDRVERRRTRRA